MDWNKFKNIFIPLNAGCLLRAFLKATQIIKMNQIPSLEVKAVEGGREHALQWF